MFHAHCQWPPTRTIPPSSPPLPTWDNAQDLKVTQAATVKATNLQAQQSAVNEKLKVALANETVNVENERNAKLGVTKERLTELNSMVGWQLVGQ